MRLISMISVAMLAAPVNAQTPPLAASGKWSVEYHEAMCVLSRDFGVGEDKVTFGLRSITPESGLLLLLVHASPGDRGSRQGKASVSIDGGGAVGQLNYESRVNPTSGLRFDTVFLKPEARAGLTAAKSVTVALGGGPATTIALSGITSAMRALKSCERDLAGKFGIDLVVLDSIVVPAEPIGDAAGWFAASGYPSDALRMNEQGTSFVVWTIGLDGRARDCRVAQSSGSTSLDKASCQMISQQARYRPAIGKEGKPIVSQQWRRVRWVIP